MARHLTPGSQVSTSKRVLNEEAKMLLARQQQQTLSPEGQRHLLQKLIVLGRDQEAMALLQQFEEQQPKALIWPLMITELKRRNGDLVGARDDIDQLLKLHPDNQKVLELKSFLELESGQGAATIEMLTSKLASQPKGKRLQTGLLLADVQLQTGEPDLASAIYINLASEYPTDPRPLLALALLKQEQGHHNLAQELLIKARKRRTKSGEADPLIDSLAAQWSLRSARERLTNHEQSTQKNPTVEKKANSQLQKP